MKTLTLLLILAAIAPAQQTDYQLRELQYQLDDIRKSMQRAQSDRDAAHWQAQQQEKARSEKQDIEFVVSTLEKQFKAGEGLSNGQVEWVKAAGYFGKKKKKKK